MCICVCVYVYDHSLFLSPKPSKVLYSFDKERFCVCVCVCVYVCVCVCVRARARAHAHSLKDRLSILFYWSMSLSLCQYHTILMTIALQYGLELGSMISPAFSSFSSCFGYLESLCFNRNFEFFSVTNINCLVAYYLASRNLRFLQFFFSSCSQFQVSQHCGWRKCLK